MNVSLPQAGVYVIAVSGGVDSMALLHMLNQARQESPGLKLVVAHLDHGIREDSIEDRRLVQAVARDYGLPFVFHNANLGSSASEDKARQARYEFLHKVADVSAADSVITAHHEDDVMETAALNILRGSGRKGLSSLSSSEVVLRPLLKISKNDLQNYAEEHGIKWREDSTNKEDVYARNYVRHNVLSKLDPESRQYFSEVLDAIRQTNNELDELIAEELALHIVNGRLDKFWFVNLSHKEAMEIMAGWLRLNGIRNFDRKMLDRLVVAGKVGQNGSQHDVLQGVSMVVWADNLALAA